MPLARQVVEKGLGAVVGGNAGRHDQTCPALRSGEAEEGLSEHRVEIHVTATGERVAGPFQQKQAGGLARMHSVFVGVMQQPFGRVRRCLCQGGDEPAACRRVRRGCYLGAACGEELLLL